MELRDFITATLSEIQAGVQGAINTTISARTNGAINPHWGTLDEIDRNLVQQVHFDIAVTTAERSNSGVEGGIKVVGINLGGTDRSAAERSHVSRIQFSIPVIPPVTTVTRGR